MSSALPQVPSRSLNDTGDRQKYDINNIEHSKLEDGPDPEVHETAFVNLSKWQVVKKFWRATIFCYMCTFGIIMDGFQASLPGMWSASLIALVLRHSGGIVANPGFVAVYGTLRTATGAPALNPQHLSAWAGTLSRWTSLTRTRLIAFSNSLVRSLEPSCALRSPIAWSQSRYGVHDTHAGWCKYHYTPIAGEVAA